MTHEASEGRKQDETRTGPFFVGVLYRIHRYLYGFNSAITDTIRDPIETARAATASR